MDEPSARGVEFQRGTGIPKLPAMAGLLTSRRPPFAASADRRNPSPWRRIVNVIERIRDRTATVAIIGMGRVGLPLGIAFAQAGLRVSGLDSDETRRRSIELGKMPFHEPGAEQPLLEVVNSGKLTVHDDPAEAVPRADVVILSVGTPLAAD